MDYDAMLNQTNIDANNNKFYKLQIIEEPGGTYNMFTRWARVGEDGATQIKSSRNPTEAIAEFKKKFRDKTQNNWDERASFAKVPGKYHLLEMDYSEAANKLPTSPIRIPTSSSSSSNDVEATQSSKLPNETQELISLIFDKQMMKDSMSFLQVDTTRLPLGALTKSQIQKGEAVLEELENEVNKTNPNRQRLQELSSQYYTLIPTVVGRNVPPVRNTKEMIQQKFDLLAVLGDIESAQEMEKKNLKLKKRLLLPHHFLNIQLIVYMKH